MFTILTRAMTLNERELKKDHQENDESFSGDQNNVYDYYEFKGMMVLERYFEKQYREINEIPDSDLKEKFSTKFNLTHIQTMDDIVKHLFL